MTGSNRLMTILNGLAREYRLDVPLAPAHPLMRSSTEVRAGTIASSHVVLIRDHLSRIREERIRQASWVFTSTLSLIVSGVIVIFVGLVFAVMGRQTSGLSLSAIGGLLETISAVLLKFNKDANDRLETITTDLAAVESLVAALEYLPLITDCQKRDSAFEKLLEVITSRHRRTSLGTRQKK